MSALVPIEQRQVDFYGDELTAVLVGVGQRQEIYVPLRPVVEFLGLEWSGQYRRLQRDQILSEAAKSVVVTTTDIDPQSRRPRTNEMTALPLKFLPGFLFGISAARVRPELRQRILRYQRDCYDVLWEAFQDGRLTADPLFDELLAADTPAVETYRMLQAVTRLARNQVLLEGLARETMERLELLALAQQTTDGRLEELAALVADPGHKISAAQATRISQAVKAIAMHLSRASGRNEYGGVYGELYRRFEIPGYRELPARRFEEAMSWLTAWWQQVAGDDQIPF